jgi:hypothetical protein
MSPAHQKKPLATSRVERRGRAETQTAPVFTKVQLRIHKLSCETTTKEVDQDEIVLAAIQAEGEVVERSHKKELRARARKGDILALGKFKKGEDRSYSDPKVVAEFALGARDLDWPRSFVAMLLLVEKDEGEIGAVVNAAVKAVEDDVTAALSKAAVGAASGVAAGLLAGSAAGSVVPIVGTAIGAAVGAAAAGALSAIKNSRRDDVFPPEVVDLSLKSGPRTAGEIDGSRGVARFKAFKGSYKLVYSWSVK